MPPLPTDAPEKIKPYLFHGLDLNYGSGKEATGECPFCGKKKFSVNIENGLWRCLVCNEGSKTSGKATKGGNVYVFMRALWGQSIAHTPEAAYEALATDRRLFSPATLGTWGVAKSSLSGDWLVPGFGLDGKLNQLYRYCKLSGKSRLYATPGCGHQLFHPRALPKKFKTLYVTEGPWDGMAMWEILSRMNSDFEFTTKPAQSLLQKSCVVAVPGCNAFSESWLSLFSGRNVVLMYDNDHPRKHPKTDDIIEPEGFRAMQSVVEQVSAQKANLQPKLFQFLWWGKPSGTVDHDPELPAGFDLRDAVCKSDSIRTRIKLFRETISERITDVPDNWVDEEIITAKKVAKGELQPIPCSEYKQMHNSWRKAMKWIDGLDHALTVMLASAISTRMIGDQLWIKVLGPASCGKSTLAEALSVNKDYVVAKSTFRGFYSGITNRETGEDCGLISQLSDMTFILKDGDTLMSAPNVGQILSEARDIYDTTGRTHYRTGKQDDYTGMRMTWILCGTSSLRSLDSSELGERFLDCVVMEDIDTDLEDEIVWRTVNEADRNVSVEASSKAKQYSPEKIKAFQLTAGYLGFLRENAAELIGAVKSNTEALRHIANLGKFVSYMRARPSERQIETAERELAARLASQHMRLAKCIAAVHQKTELDVDVLKRTTKVAMDTARGITLKMMECLEREPRGLQTTTLAHQVNQGVRHVGQLLRFLRKIGAVDHVYVSGKTKATPRWQMTPKFFELYRQVVSTNTAVVND